MGVLFDSKIEFVSHINNIVSATMRNLGFSIRNGKSFTNQIALKSLYFALVRSRLEYAAIVWDPLYQIHANVIENVQKRFLKYMYFKLDGIYPRPEIDQTVMFA